MNNKDNYKQCVKCLMDTTTKRIEFDENGICNFCKKHESTLALVKNKSEEEKKVLFENLINEIKKIGEGKKYDCLIGISGGFDSTFITYLAKNNNLKPLLVHFDNGWNTNQATENINNIVKNTEFDLYTYVINWEQFKDLQIAYFKASVIDIEVPTDQLIFAALYTIAEKFNIKSILSGENIYTETVMPSDWAFSEKLDYTNLSNIHKKFGKQKLVNFPKLGISEQEKFNRKGFKKYKLITYSVFDYHQIIEAMQKELGWKNFEDKHFESIFTRFYQGYILPKKFNVDKRKVHYSNLINSGFIPREKALQALKNPPYNIEMQHEDLNYILKKWDMTKSDFDHIMSLAPVSHDTFGYDKLSNTDKFKNWLQLFYKFKIAYPLRIIKRPL